MDLLNRVTARSMRMEPDFKKDENGIPILTDIRTTKQERQGQEYPSEEEVKAFARMAVESHGGDVNNEWHILGQYKFVFGAFRDKTFLWVAENSLDYAGWLIASMSFESKEEVEKNHPNHIANKEAFRRYISHYPEGRYAIAVKRGDLPAAATAPAFYVPNQLQELQPPEHTPGLSGTAAPP